MAKSRLIRILAKGGILTPGYLLKIINLAEKNSNTAIHFGSRQDVLFKVQAKNIQKISSDMRESRLDYEWKDEGAPTRQNIVSSFVSNGILPSTNWINEGAYLFILESFKYFPKLKINIVDPKQNLLPLFNGYLNYIASQTEGYWYLYIRDTNNTGFIKWPYLVHSSDIASLSKYIEENNSGELLQDSGNFSENAREQLKNKYLLAEGSPLPPRGFFPYYEGLNRMGQTESFWAGFYWRNNEYSINFLKQVCQLCLNTSIAKISITPWKSFIVKDIQLKNRLDWEQLIGRFGINMRHSSFELNWHLPVIDKAAYQLKKYIVRAFDKIDVRTYGLTFSITDHNKTDVLTTIQIKRKPLFKLLGASWGMRYSIDVMQNFVPQLGEYKCYARNIAKREIAGNLIEISRQYYNSLGYQNNTSPNPIKTNTKTTDEAHQCPACLTIYHAPSGDIANNINPGTLFYQLPDGYCCPTCGEGKNSYIQIEIARELIQNP